VPGNRFILTKENVMIAHELISVGILELDPAMLGRRTPDGLHDVLHRQWSKSTVFSVSSAKKILKQGGCTH
jgi:hypothetical protein